MPSVAESVSKAQTAVLAAAIIASGMSYIDSTALIVALPVMKAKLPATDGQAQWIIEGYLLFLSALILIGGALGDRYGRRRLFALGTWIFALSSIACALAAHPGFLIVARCVQGAGAAFMIPESLALITAAYGARERGRAIGIWAAASAVTMAAGPVLGGWLTQTFSWRWVFWINIPLAFVVLSLAYLRVPESRAKTNRGQPDVLGSACITVALGLIVMALMRMQHRFADPASLAMLAVGILLFVAFVFIERRSSAPVAPLHLFTSRAFTVTNLYTFLLYAALGGALFFVPFELQHIMFYTPLSAGLALLPTIALIAVCSPFSGMLAARIGARIPLVVGAGIASLGFALFVRLHVGAPYLVNVLPATIVLGMGLAIAISPLVTAVMGAADADDVGAASGINNSISRIGNLVAIAVFGIVIAVTGGGPLPTAAHPEGFQHAMFSAGALSLAAAVVALFYGPNPKNAVP
jgi:EmrB/QacA subfamily drug resistance transporter